MFDNCEGILANPMKNSLAIMLPDLQTNKAGANRSLLL